MQLDLDRLPFSRRESNLVISRAFSEQIGEVGRYYLRHVYNGSHRRVFELSAGDNDSSSPPHATAIPERFELGNAVGSVDIAMPAPNELRIRCRGIRLRMTATGPRWKLMIPAGENRWRSIIGDCKLLWQPIRGELEVNAPWRPASGQAHRHHGCEPIEVTLGRDAEIAVTCYESECHPKTAFTSFDQAVEDVRHDFDAWLTACPATPPKFQRGRHQAAYLGWSSVVPASGNFDHPAMLMSKNWMVRVWNWDNYFNAWASAYRDPGFAWRQFLLYFQHQHPTGALGDGITEKSIGWAFAKPPVHAWVLRRMMEITPAIGEDLDRLAEIYEPLVRSTEWWFNYRDDDRDGICQYHHGNDSGWDDATAFDAGAPTEMPDLSALLVLQMDVLSQLAKRLGRIEDVQSWSRRSRSTLDKLIRHSWRDGRFVSMQSGTHRVSQGESLLNSMPLVLGRLLPTEVLDSLTAMVMDEDRFLTPWGLATEAINSDQFLPTGYWRGAVWPPAVLMIVDGLADAGRVDQAAEITRRFANLCATHGFAENFNPLTGTPHYDPAYTWCSSVWQILVTRMCENRGKYVSPCDQSRIVSYGDA